MFLMEDLWCSGKCCVRWLISLNLLSVFMLVCLGVLDLLAIIYILLYWCVKVWLNLQMFYFFEQFFGFGVVFVVGFGQFNGFFCGGFGCFFVVQFVVQGSKGVIIVESGFDFNRVFGLFYGFFQYFFVFYVFVERLGDGVQFVGIFGRIIFKVIYCSLWESVWVINVVVIYFEVGKNGLWVFWESSFEFCFCICYYFFFFIFCIQCLQDSVLNFISDVMFVK